MNVEIAERLAKRRREAGYSQESLAEKLGVSRQAVSKWERSESSPDTDNLIALAQLYGVSLDDLLFVDDSLKDDVAFEVADKAAARESNESGSPALHDNDQQDETSAAKKKDSFHIGFDGIHIKDGDDFVSVSWKDGVHVKDSAKGEEVHVGFDGVYVNDKKSSCSGDSAYASSDSQGRSGDWEDAKVFINGKKYDSWKDVEVAFQDKYGMRKTWLKFPFPLVAIIAYILIGVFLGAWAVGLFVFFSIPVYYMIAHAAYSRQLGHFLAGFYPLASIAWFLWMAFVVGQPHPAWVVFLTIPVFEWIIHAASKSYRRHKKAAEVIDATGTVE